MGAAISSLRPPPLSTATPVIPTSVAPTPSPSDADIRTYEATLRDDDTLRRFDSALQTRTSRAINSIALGLDGSLSLGSLSQVIEWSHELNHDVVNVILRDKREIWKNKELSDLVEDYFDNSLLTLDFCNSLEACLKRAAHIESIIKIALRNFQEENSAVPENGSTKNYTRTLEKLEDLRNVGDPFTEEFLQLFISVFSKQRAMLERLLAKKKKISTKLAKMKTYQRISNVIFVAAFATVLICSVVAAAVSAPPVVTALAAALAVPMGSMGKLLNSTWRKYEKDLTAQMEIVSSIQIRSSIVIKDLENIRVQVEKLQIGILSLISNAEFAMRGVDVEGDVSTAVEEIRKEVLSFCKTVV